ncbi:alpha-galactosidase mel1-like [Hordeum vulgare subsp. vulgare]|uniref:Alpha-galactosidase n=1 Tax=Hordeum vulgare subsp. vulgare TaxID=112509 RepID=A0A8I6YF93_HORVV|nr:alpha-galactosidase mel1-like [Hordeum vulgare subsp. vulgare]
MAMGASPRVLCVIVLLASLLTWGSCDAAGDGRRQQLTMLPPRGWNSYDSFSWTIDEAAFLHNAQIMADKLLPHGYQYAVIDFLWYRKNVNGSGKDSYGFDSVDQWGRPFPDPERFPSSAGGKGFKHIADRVHAMGLKFGIHLMNGISTQAVNASTPVLDVHTGKAYVEDGRQWTARDIGITHRTCAWMSNGFMSVNTDVGAGRAFLRSLYQQYADWGVDFVKVDCIFGTDYSPKEIVAVSETLKELERPVILSISPGTEATPALAENISQHVDMYRITGDDWDNWKDVRPHFDVARSFADANKIGATALRGRSWPDLDMLPFGRLTDAGVNQGPHRSTNLTFDEQLTQMVLWSMVKSPLMYGGDLRHLDDETFNLITHPTLLKINHHTKNNMEFGDIHSERTSEPNEQSGRSDLANNGGTVLGLSTCSDKRASGWYSSSNDQICRSYGIQNRNASFCISKAKLRQTVDGVTMRNEEDQAKFHLAGMDTDDGCLDASASPWRTSSASRTPMFSTCERHSKQVWELTENGHLVSSYSGLCATVHSSKEGESETTGARAWTATGDKGEIYVAFFNLDTASRKIAVRVPDLEKVAGRKLARKHLCTCTEVLSGKSRSLMKGDISAVVSSHGSMLFEIQC